MMIRSLNRKGKKKKKTMALFLQWKLYQWIKRGCNTTVAVKHSISEGRRFAVHSGGRFWRRSYKYSPFQQNIPAPLTQPV